MPAAMTNSVIRFVAYVEQPDDANPQEGNDSTRGRQFHGTVASTKRCDDPER